VNQHSWPEIDNIFVWVSYRSYPTERPLLRISFLIQWCNFTSLATCPQGILDTKISCPEKNSLAIRQWPMGYLGRRYKLRRQQVHPFSHCSTGCIRKKPEQVWNCSQFRKTPICIRFFIHIASLGTYNVE
jgi:hypothetical protein